ncbi:MAG TPA: M14 metallopeptidase family protein [Longimicrobium sp.]|jgi:hypothetical protein
MPTIHRTARFVALAAVLAASAAPAQTRVTSPREQFGHDIGADYVLPNYRQLVAYWQKLDAQSDRMRMVEMGKTAEGRTEYMAFVSSPANLRNLDLHRSTVRRLALARGVDSTEARRLARTGKAVVWIDGGLHASEVLGAQQLMETLYQLVSRNDAETMRILNDVIILFVHANPDGMDLVSDWYMRNPNPQQRSTGNIPRLYQKYIGHDNNRDFYASTQPETENMNRVMYLQWFPQIVYNHHQTGPTGTVMFAPPFRDPFNYVYDPLVVTELDQVGAAMQTRFIAENKPGVTTRTGSNYSTWWNGGLRTTAYFHNMVGLLTETIGNPTPMNIPFVANRQLPSGDLISPVAPQRWHFRQSIDYSVTANYAVLDMTSRYRETLLMNQWRMGANAIERGNRDTWTPYPRRIAEVRDSMHAARRGGRTDTDPVMAAGGQFGDTPNPQESQRYLTMLRRPEWRDPRGYVLPSNQPDFPTATKFVNALLETGVEVHRATAEFSVAGKRYPAGSYVVKTSQAFRPHVLDMFEPQDHPNDFRYEGGPPIPPYDVAGWTLAYQMGVKFDRIMEGFTGPFQRIDSFNTRPAPGRVATPRYAAAAYLLSAAQNDAFTVVNRLLAAGVEVQRLSAPLAANGETYPAGTWVIPARAQGVYQRLSALAAELGVDVEALAEAPAGAMRVRPLRIGLWDRFGGSMPSGWNRYLFDQWGFSYRQVFAQELDAGNLNAKYDVLIFHDGAIPEEDRPARGEPDPATIPAEYRAHLGNVSIARTVPQLRAFLEGGGKIVAIGSSTILAHHLGLPVNDHLVERTSTGDTVHLSREKFFIPGSVLQVRVDPSRPVAWGLDERVDVMFDDSPVFRLGSDAAARGVRPVAWYEGKTPLRSGWAWGQDKLDGGVAAAEAAVGKGTLYLFGPEITFRAQPHGTFKLLFNTLYGM